MRAETLPFPGETPIIYIQQSAPSQSVAIVYSCAPFPAGCTNPQLKARSVKHKNPENYIWEFADLRNCQDAETLVSALRSNAKTEPFLIKFYAGPEQIKTAKQHAAETLVTTLEACLSKSYMTPPWAR